MEWIQVIIYTSSCGIEPVCGVLYNLGIDGLEIEDFQDFQDFIENNKDAWDYVDEKLEQKMSKETCIKLYLTDDASGYESLKNIESVIASLKETDIDNSYGRLSISLGHLKEEDWCNNWKQYFKPLCVGDKILICPEWEDVPDEQGKTVFKINPGMSFGTGSHETTQLCIEAVEKYIKKGDSVLDLGCGSGILSIISMLLGAKDAIAVDIDPNAVKIAIENATKNGVDLNDYHAIAGNILTDSALCKELSSKTYNIVFANIVADVIISLKPILPDFMDEDSILIVSGIIDTRLDDVLDEYNDSLLKILNITKKGEWASITLKKR